MSEVNYVVSFKNSFQAKQNGSLSAKEVDELILLITREGISSEQTPQVQQSDCEEEEPECPMIVTSDVSGGKRSRTNESQPASKLSRNRSTGGHKTGSFDVILRKDLKTLKGVSKLNTLIDIETQVQEMDEGECFTEAMRLFNSQVLKPALLCFRAHCNGDKQAFIQRWGESFRTSKFSSKCCNGHSECRGIN